MNKGRDLLRFPRSLARIIRPWLLAVFALGATRGAWAQEAGFLDDLLDHDANIMLVLDGSGSMGADWQEGASKFESARQTILALADNLPQTTSTGALTFGHRRNFDCSDIEVLTNPVVGGLALRRAVENQEPQDRGMRPLADAIETAAARLSQQKGAGAIIVLTDGAEECGGNSCSLTGPLAQLQIPVHIVGIGMKTADASLLRCLPANTGGSLTIAETPDELSAQLDKAFAVAHTSNAQKTAAAIARLLLQEQDISLRNLKRIQSDIDRLEDALAALTERSETAGSLGLISAELDQDRAAPVATEFAVIREAVSRLKAQLGSRDQMLIRLQDQTDGWNAATLALRRQVEIAEAMAVLSVSAVDPAQRLKEGHGRLVQRRAALETEMAASAAQSADLQAAANALLVDLDRGEQRLASASQIAEQLQEGAPLDLAASQDLGENQPLLQTIAERDQMIADLKTDKSALLEQLKALRTDLQAAQADILIVEKQRAEAQDQVLEARDLLSSLQANQLALQSGWQGQIDEVSINHLKDKALLNERLDSVLAESDTLRAELIGMTDSLVDREATIETLERARLAMGADLEDARLQLVQMETQNEALMNGLSSCRMGQEDLSRHIAALEADLEEAQEIAVSLDPDRVRIVLSADNFDPELSPEWSVENLETAEVVASGAGAELELPKTPGQYRVTAELSDQLVEETFSVRAFGRSDHELALGLVGLELQLKNLAADAQATGEFKVNLSSPLFARRLIVQAAQSTMVYLPEGEYELSLERGLTRWSQSLSLAAGPTVETTIELNLLPVALDLVAGDKPKPLKEGLPWTLQDARNPGEKLSFAGPQADLFLEPGVYDVDVDFGGFTASQTLFVDNAEVLSKPLAETIEFNDGAVRLAFTNNGEGLPTGLDLDWRIELNGAAIVTSQTLDGDMVQLPAGGYHLVAQANDVELDRDFLVLAGQVTELRPDFSLGEVTLRLLDETGLAFDASNVEWSVLPQDAGSDFGGSMTAGLATQTLLLPEGRYRVTASTDSGDVRVQRLISVRSGDKASFGLVVPAQEDEQGLAALTPAQ